MVQASYDFFFKQNSGQNNFEAVIKLKDTFHRSSMGKEVYYCMDINSKKLFKNQLS